MQYIITPPAHINTTIHLPASKSISNRALILSALSANAICPENLSDCDDTAVIVKALAERPATIDIQAAGTAMRFMTAYLSVSEGEHILTGTERMQERPIKILVEALRFLGADIEYVGKEGYPPLKIKGKRLEGGSIEVAGNVSSQYISALLMIAPMLKNGLTLKLLDSIVSRPYIDLTLHVMHQYGIEAEWNDMETITIPPQTYEAMPYFVENDWTAASYWYEIITILNDKESQIMLPELFNGSRQGDAGIQYIFSLLGVKTTFSGDGQQSQVCISRQQRQPTRLEYDFKNQPDLAQTLIALCPLLNLPFRFTGLSNLRIKETDRVKAMKIEMEKLGYIIYTKNDEEVVWDGERCVAQPLPIIDTYDDHRMAMAFAPLSIKLGRIGINHPEVVSKSYPNFWQDMQKAGFKITPYTSND